MIQIKNPCDANWQQMTPAESGKYCGACEKVVVDFSKMNDVQIKTYFTNYAAQKTCGRFLNTQLDRPLVVPAAKKFNAFLNRLNQIPVTRAVLFFLTSISMWVSSCVKNNNDDMTTGEILPDTLETYNTPQLVDDDTTPAVKQQDNLLLLKPDNQVTGEATLKMLPPDVLMGDVCVSPPDEPDTVAVTFPAGVSDTSDVTLHMIKGKVMMTDTISQTIKRKKR